MMSVNLPPGFCFSPTDEELLLHFLYPKTSLPCHPNIIPDLDLSLHDPWHLNGILSLYFISTSNNFFNHMHASMDPSTSLVSSDAWTCGKLLIYKFHLFFFSIKTTVHDPKWKQKIISIYICLVFIFTIYLGKALSSGNEQYFFSRAKENRSTENGYWKEIGLTEAIVSASEKVGLKKYLVFNLGEAPQGTETSWFMQEYHICSSSFSTASSGSTRGRRKSVSN